MPQGATTAGEDANTIPSNAAGAIEALNQKLASLLAYVDRLRQRVDL